MKYKEAIKANVFVLLLGFMLVLPLASAGVGISWDQESSLVPENTKTCLTYKIYNPWPEDSYVEITLSDELMPIIEEVETEVMFVPKETSSSEALPAEFCFKTPRVYERDCLVFNKLICKQDCVEEMKIYEGEVIVSEVSEPTDFGSGAGGSASAISVGAPLRVKVQCVEHKRNYSIIYIIIAAIAAILLAINLLKRKKKK